MTTLSSFFSFRLFGIPVKVQWIFLLVTVALGSTGSRALDWLAGWIAVVFVSVLVHELGHAAAFRLFGLRPSIELIGMGGLTTAPLSRPLTWWQQVSISLAGPFAGFALGALAFLGARFAPSVVLEGSFGQTLLNQALWVNLVWGLVNLLPVLPLDGGQALQAILVRLVGRRGVTAARGVTLTFVSAAALWSLSTGKYLELLLLLGFGYVNVKPILEEVIAKRRASRRHAAPTLKAASLLLRGDAVQARRLLSTSEADPDSMLVLACADLEAGNWTSADARARQLASRNPPASSFISELARRRQGTARGSWVVDFAAAWNACGRPDFSANEVLLDAPEPIENLSESQLVQLGHTPVGLLARLSQIESCAELSRFAADVVRPDAPVPLKHIGYHLASTPAGSQRVRAAMLLKKQACLQELQSAHPRNLHFELLRILHESDSTAPLTLSELAELELARRCTEYEVPFGEVYRYAKGLFVAVGISQPTERAFQVSTHALDMPSSTLYHRASATFPGAGDDLRQRVLEVLRFVAERVGSGPTLVERIWATWLEEAAATAESCGEKEEAATVERTRLMTLREFNMKRGRWPIRTLYFDLYDQIAADEMAWMSLLGDGSASKVKAVELDTGT